MQYSLFIPTTVVDKVFHLLVLDGNLYTLQQRRKVSQTQGKTRRSQGILLSFPWTNQIHQLNTCCRKFRPCSGGAEIELPWAVTERGCCKTCRAPHFSPFQRFFSSIKVKTTSRSYNWYFLGTSKSLRGQNLWLDNISSRPHCAVPTSTPKYCQRGTSCFREHLQNATSGI